MPEILQNIKVENRLDKIRIVSENDDVIGGQPSSEGNEENDNNAIFDLACTAAYSIEKSKNAQLTADTADGKATVAQIKADQVPNPIKDRFLVGNTTTAYVLKTIEEVKDLLGINDDIPIGATFAWDFEEAPKNYLFKRGQSFSASDYPKLALLFPSLRLPDDRGVVHRGLDAGRGFDPGRVLGSYQADATQHVRGTFPIWTITDYMLTGAINGDYHSQAGVAGNAYARWRGWFDNSLVARTANEERVKSNATNFIIKAK